MRAPAPLPAPLRTPSRALLLALAGCASAAAAPDADQQLARDIFEELIQINTTQSAGDTHQAAKAMAARLLAAGFPAADVRVFETAPLQVSETAHRYFHQMAALESGQVAADLKAIGGV